MEEDNKSAYVIAYAFVNFIGILTGLFLGWAIWG